MDKKTLIGLSLLTVMLVGCQTTKNNAPNTKATQANTSQAINLALLKDNRWLIKSIINSNNHMLNLEKWRSGRGLAYFEFYENQNKSAYSHMTNMDTLIGFTYGCNDFSAGVSLIGNRLIVDKTIIGTLVGCGDSEDELNDALKGENILSYDAKANLLTITTHKNYRFILEKFEKPKPIVPSKQDLERYDWQIQGIDYGHMTQTDAQVLAYLKIANDTRSYPLLKFENGRAYYSVGCHQLLSDYKITPYGIANTINSVPVFTECANELGNAKNILQSKMQGPSELLILKENKETAKLFQKTHDGSDFSWKGKLKPEIKYGKGETIFLEVAPSDERCDQKTYKRCLMVRELSYNEQGVKTNKGEWHLWNEPIDGYEKSPNNGNVLRIKRYNTPPTVTQPAGNLYVLDSVLKITDLVR